MSAGAVNNNNNNNNNGDLFTSFGYFYSPEDNNFISLAPNSQLHQQVSAAFNRPSSSSTFVDISHQYQVGTNNSRSQHPASAVVIVNPPVPPRSSYNYLTNYSNCTPSCQFNHQQQRPASSFAPATILTPENSSYCYSNDDYNPRAAGNLIDGANSSKRKISESIQQADGYVVPEKASGCSKDVSTVKKTTPNEADTKLTASIASLNDGEQRKKKEERRTKQITMTNNRSPKNSSDDSCNKGERDNYTFILHVPVSSEKVDSCEGRVGFVNRNQYYWLEFFERADTSRKAVAIKSIIALSLKRSTHFDEAKLWNCWYNRQKSKTNGQEPLAIDIDRHSSRFCNVPANGVENISLNAVSVQWPTRLPGRKHEREVDGNNEEDKEEPFFRVQIRFGCLSTDFSTQKGVRGLQLFLVVDTYENNVRAHRAYAKLQIYCDKGAERKIREEDKKRRRLIDGRSCSSPTAEQDPIGSSTMSGCYKLDPCGRDFPYEMFNLRSHATRNTTPNTSRQNLSQQLAPACNLQKESTGQLAKNNGGQKITFYVRSKDEQIASPIEISPWQCNVRDLKQALIRHYSLRSDRLRNVTVRLNNGNSKSSGSGLEDGLVISPLAIDNSIFFVHCEQVTPLPSATISSTNNCALITNLFDLHLIQLTKS